MQAEGHHWVHWTPFLWAGLWILFVLVLRATRSRERLRTYDLMEKAMQSGQIPPDVWAQLGRRPWNARSDLRWGLILVAVGVGLAAGGVIHYYTTSYPNPSWFSPPYGMFPVPLAIGVAFLIMACIRRETP